MFEQELQESHVCLTTIMAGADSPNPHESREMIQDPWHQQNQNMPRALPQDSRLDTVHSKEGKPG